MGEPTVRETTAADVSAVIRVAESGWRAAYGDVLAPETIERSLGEWYGRSTVRERTRREEEAHFVAEFEGVVGFASGARSDRAGVAMLGAIYVEPDHWGAGVGSALLTRFERWCHRRNCREIRLRVLDGNDRAVAFYRDHGYEPVEEVEGELFGESITERVFRGCVD